ncbi:putative quinol monooxygenase [Brevibacterium moorei]|uniref:putative quinol monooxygenase n=1 Tax=Brevibacterium moorei TaxID=2968457 RepID=UPI00211C6381|nr:putative quinol monooxygenase [Brevibacterium sp. 68QC2CO]MCQ9385463.1 antibiotic biosynthesis monooxygenase [Brevibacterium sp. 68QC2CO]
MTDDKTAGQTAHFLALAHYYPAAGNEARVLELLVELTEASRREAGNVSYDFYAPGSNAGEILIVERYVDADAFTVHRESEHFAAIGKAKIIPLLNNRVVEEFAI